MDALLKLAPGRCAKARWETSTGHHFHSALQQTML